MKTESTHKSRICIHKFVFIDISLNAYVPYECLYLTL